MNKKASILSLVGLLLLVHFLPAQSKMEPLKHKLSTHRQIDTLYVESLFNLAYAHSRTGTDSMLLLGKRVIEISDSLKYGAGLSMGYRALCAYFEDLNEMPTAIIYGKKAAQIADSVGRPMLKARALNNLASIYIKGEPDKALACLLEAQPLFHQAGDKKWEAISYQTMGNLYREMADYEKSIAVHEKALALFQQIENMPQGVPGQYVNIGLAYKVMGEVQPDSVVAYGHFEQARDFLEKGMEAFEKTDQLFGATITATNLGTLLVLMKKHYLALAAYDKALTYNEQFKHQGIDFISRWGKIEILYKLKQWEEAKSLALALLAEKAEMANSENLSDIYETLFKISMELGEYEEAYGFAQQKIESEKQIEWNTNLKTQLTELSSQYEAQLQEADLALLAEDRRTNQIYQLAAFGFLFVLILLAAIWLLQAQKIRKQQLLIQAEKTAKNLALESLAAEKLLQAANEKRQLQEEIALKNRLLSSQALQIARKNEWLEKLHEQLQAAPNAQTLRQEVKLGLDQDRNWEEIGLLFEEVHPDFLPKLKQAFPDLSKSDLRLAALHAMGLSKEEMIELMGIAPESLKMSRYRLRKKLGIESNEALAEFLNTYQ